MLCVVSAKSNWAIPDKFEVGIYLGLTVVLIQFTTEVSAILWLRTFSNWGERLMTFLRNTLFMLASIILCAGCWINSADGYILNSRWSSTATNGSGLQLGDPTMLTWSIVPDGTSNDAEGNSNLIATFDSIFGSMLVAVT